MGKGAKVPRETSWYHVVGRDISGRDSTAFSKGRHAITSHSPKSRTLTIELTAQDLETFTGFEAYDEEKHHGPLWTDHNGNISCVVLPVVVEHRQSEATAKRVAQSKATVYMQIARWDGTKVLLDTGMFMFLPGRSSKTKEARQTRRHIWRIGSHGERVEDLPVLRKDVWVLSATATVLMHLACLGRPADAAKLREALDELRGEFAELDEGTEGMQLEEEAEVEIRTELCRIGALIQRTMEEVQGRVRPGQVFGELFHVGTLCAACGIGPISGWMYTCTTCGDNLCSKTEACVGLHHRDHIITLIRQPTAVQVGSVDALAVEQQQFRMNGIDGRRRQPWAPGRPRSARNRPYQYQINWEGYDPTWELAVDLAQGDGPDGIRAMIARANQRFGARGDRRRRRALLAIE